MGQVGAREPGSLARERGRETAVSRAVVRVGLHFRKITLATLWRLVWREANWRQRGQSEGI